MALDIKKAEARLRNIEAVTPVLAALRTISLGSWRMSLNRSRHLDAYTDSLLALLPYLLPHISPQRPPRNRWLSLGRRDPSEREKPSDGRTLVAVVMGSERGLCGQYNAVLIDRLGNYLQKKREQNVEVSLIALGSRVIREVERVGYEIDVRRSLSITRLPSQELAREFVARWLADYESYTVDGVDFLYNAEAGAGTYEPTSFRLIPPSLPSLASEPVEVELEGLDSTQDVIIESDPVGIYARIIEEWTVTTAYELMLEAAGTEHSARYQLMESATQNAEALIETLSRDIKTGRRREITREMQELAVAAGLLSE
jgi:F-type H+-transporting ATPase subunit gamma